MILLIKRVWDEIERVCVREVDNGGVGLGWWVDRGGWETTDIINIDGRQVILRQVIEKVTKIKVIENNEINHLWNIQH